ncbi:MAG: hypothetical protein RIB03_12575 [Henriciella sp.]|uniref:hypothetical protein n=1 Tax=Henriciella sp. TaxID=1968823 RepID=UPI0032EEEBCE
MRFRYKRTNVWLSCLASLFLLSVFVQGTDAQAAPDPAVIRTGDAFEALADSIEESLYSEEGLIEVLGYDVDAAARFVRDQITYEPYEGVLRGPEGVIATGAGSSWDQAVLSAALIHGMGGEAMLVRGPLAPADADRLLARSGVGRKPLAKALEADDVLAAFDDLLPETAMTQVGTMAKGPGAASVDVDIAVNSLADAIAEALQKGGVTLGEGRTDYVEKLLERLAAEYVWVRYRDTPGDPWTDLHPAFGSDAAPEVKPEAFLNESVPEDRLHQVELKLEIERTGSGGEPERIAIMRPYARPAANFASTQVPIGIAPSAPVTTGDMPEFFVPTLFGEAAPGAQVFNGFGLTASAEDALAGPGVFGEVAGKLALGSASVGGGDAPALLGVILTVTYIEPGGGRTREERRIVDLRDLDREAFAKALPVEGVIDIGVGRENGARELHGVLKAQPDRLQVTSVLADVAIRRDEVDAREARARMGDVGPAGWPDMVLRGGALEPGEGATFRTGPLVIMRRVRPNADHDGFASVIMDILHNPVLSLNKEGRAIDPAAALRQGVRESILEGAIIGDLSQTPWVERDMGAVLTSRQAVETYSQQAALSEGVRERMLADQARAGAIVIANRGDVPYWWRIDPVTGQSLGMGIHGGQTTVERIITVGLSAYSWYSVIASYQGCEDTFPENDKMYLCCLGANSVMFGLGNAAGNRVGNYIDDQLVSGVGWIMSTLTFEAHMQVFDHISGLGINSSCRALYE